MGRPQSEVEEGAGWQERLGIGRRSCLVAACEGRATSGLRELLRWPQAAKAPAEMGGRTRGHPEREVSGIPQPSGDSLWSILGCREGDQVYPVGSEGAEGPRPTLGLGGRHTLC